MIKMLGTNSFGKEGNLTEKVWRFLNRFSPEKRFAA
jgi:hypothetical protein